MARPHLGMSFPLRGAILGFGNVAEHAHLPVWQRNHHFRIDAVLEPHPDRAKLAKTLLPGARIYSDIESLLAGSDLDFVDVCAPPVFMQISCLRRARPGCTFFVKNLWLLPQKAYT